MRIRWLVTAVVLITLLVGRAYGDDRADMLALIDRAVKASGGEAEVAKLRALTWKTKAFVPDAPEKVIYSDETSAQGLDQYRAEVNILEKDGFKQGLMVFNKDKWWFKTGDKVTDGSKKEYIQPRLEVYYALRLPEMLLPLKEKNCELSPLGEIKVAGRDAVGVRVSRKAYPDLNVYFDKGTGLLARTEMRMTLPDTREIVTEYLVSDYKEFGGLKHFTRLVLKVNDEELFHAVLSDVQPLGHLEDTVFARP